jgi:hypothetical protein
MSVFWKTDHFGYDGDSVHGHVKVNYWQEREKVADEMDRQYAEIRRAALDEHDRLTGTA